MFQAGFLARGIDLLRSKVKTEVICCKETGLLTREFSSLVTISKYHKIFVIYICKP